ncbi:glycosyltransferase family protein [Megalodesulfovibrio paquesii]
MRICLISPALNKAMQSLGHEVICFWPTGQAEFNLPEALEQQGFTPELIIQEEFLGPRVLLTGLDKLACPKIFWSLDSHLNAHWHRWYACCFDGVVTPHRHLWEQFPWPRPPLGRLAFPGYPRPWTPHAGRGHDVSFVGRITPERPRRAWLTEFLKARCNARIEQDLPLHAMLDVYADTRLAPNEAIQAEVNFRVTEAASVGCLVLSQNIGPDQDALFEPGKEIVVYDHVLELQALLDQFRRFPRPAEAIARAGWERVQASHLPKHRAAELLRFAETLPAQTAPVMDRRLAWLLARWELVRNRRQPGSLRELGLALAGYVDHPEALAAVLETWHLLNRPQDALQLAVQIIQHPVHSRIVPLAAACSVLGLYQGQFEFARQCLLLQGEPRRPETPAALLQGWAAQLARLGRTAFPGRSFTPRMHLPACAADCLFLAMELAPHDMEITRRLESLLAACGGWEHLRLGLLSDLSLRRREDWRLGLSLGLANLKAFRLKEGLEEAALALHSARSQGKEGQFARRLEGLDPSGLLAKTLASIL